MLVIVSYDIVETKKRTKLAKKLLNYGIRVQYSVFECQLDAEKIEKMKKEMLKFVNLEKDSLRIYELCQSCAVRIQSFGIKKGWEINDDVCEVI
jgi:CRISPR-associated protein Cas2